MSIKKFFDGMIYGVPIVRSQFKLSIEDIKDRFHIKGDTKGVVISNDSKSLLIEVEK